MQKLESDIQHLKDFEVELQKRKVQCHIFGMSDGTGAIFFPKADYDKAVEAWDVVEKRNNPTASPPEQNKDKPVKKRRSRQLYSKNRTSGGGTELCCTNLHRG